MNDNSGHVRLSSTGSTRAASAAAMSTSSPWVFDTKKRNRMLKKYRTQVASATSTICATLAVVRIPNGCFLFIADTLVLDAFRKPQDSDANVRLWLWTALLCQVLTGAVIIS
jgi:hypothetical protein